MNGVTELCRQIMSLSLWISLYKLISMDKLIQELQYQQIYQKQSCHPGNLSALPRYKAIFQRQLKNQEIQTTKQSGTW
eukprot:c47928_g1_i1 orf=1-231(-)